VNEEPETCQQWSDTDGGCSAVATHYSRCCGYSCLAHACRRSRPVEAFDIPNSWEAL
jgi:hypothetical protein